MASNGLEWTRDLDDEKGVIPLESKFGQRQVHVQGQSYLDKKPLTFKAILDLSNVKDCTSADFDVTFRIVLEQ
jgi:hypothetical protein